MIRQIMTPTAVTENGKLMGMRVYPGSNRQAFDKLGLKSGDLVTAINGVALNDQTKADQVFNSLSSSAEAQVTVTRNGTQHDLRLNLAEVANDAERLAQGSATTGPVQPPGPESAR
jgi:type II secretion system protein C